MARLARAVAWAIAGSAILLGAFVAVVWLLWGQHIGSFLGADSAGTGDLPGYGRPYPVGTVINIGPASPPPGSDPALIRIVYPFPRNVVINDPAAVTAMSESPNGDYLAWGDGAGNVFVWQVGTDKLIALNDIRLGRSVERKGISDILAIRIYDDGGGLCWMDWEDLVWEAQPKRGDEWSKRALYKRAFSWSGTFTEDSFIQVRCQNTWTKEYVLEKYNILTGRHLGTCKLYARVKGDTHFVEEMSLSTDEKLLAVVSECNAGVVDMDDFRLLRSFGVTGGDRIAISPKGSWVALWTVRWDLFVWDVSTGRLVHKLKYPGCGGGPLAFPSDGSLWFATWGIHRLDLATGQTEVVISKGVNASQMMFSRDRSRLYVGTRHGALYVFMGPSESKASSKSTGH